VPQVHGAVRDALDQLSRVPRHRSSTPADRHPLVFPTGGVADDEAIATGGGRVISGGTSTASRSPWPLDYAKLAVAELGSIS
jgi:histidine ammonia-lyase